MSKVIKTRVFNEYINDFLNGKFDLINFFNDSRYNEIWSLFYNDLKRYNRFIVDGRRDDIFMSVLKTIKNGEAKDIEYKNFLMEILSKIREYDVDNFLMLPLNGINKDLLPDVLNFGNEDIKIFSVKEKGFKKSNGKTIIAKYYEDRIGGKLNMQHMMLKEKNMFNTPVLTVIIKGQNDNEIYHSAQEISQGFYSLVRIYDLLYGKKKTNYNNFSWLNYPTSYAVYRNYYNSMFDTYGDHGHQMKIFCTPILDVDTEIFLKFSKKIISSFSMMMDTYFEALNNMNEEIFHAKKRWINSIQMFNTAYDMASIERFDSSLVTLLSFLESLFLSKNSKNKKESLTKLVSKYLERDVYNLLDDIYTKRNKYLHDGIRVGGVAKYKLVENKHNYVPGYKPFTQNSFWGIPSEIEDIRSLMELSAEIVLKMIDSKDFLVGQYRKKNEIIKIESQGILESITGLLDMNPEDIKSFNKYLPIRGLGVYFDSINSLIVLNNNQKVTYYDFMGFIRYDKNIRDILYKMLSVYEEKVKNILYSNFDLDGKKFLTRINIKNISRIKNIDDSVCYGWNLLRNSRLDIGSIHFILKQYDFVFKSKSNDFFQDLENVRNLRNIVMHHKMLLIDQHVDIYDKTLIKVRVSKVTSYIKSLYNLLDDEYGKGLITAINRAKWDKKEKREKSRFIFIDNLEGGYDGI